MVLYFIIAAAVAAGDQLFKRWIIANIEPYGKMELIPGVVRLTHVHNTGSAFSLFSNAGWIPTVLSVVLALAIVVFIIKARTGRFGKICAGAVLGGAVGNILDRIFYGHVVDMFELEFINYPVFNVADCFIVVGVIAFFVFFLFFDGKGRKND